MWLGSIVVLGLIVWGAYVVYSHAFGPAASPVSYKSPEESDPYVRLGMEAYDKIRANYWASTTEAGLADHFQLSLQKTLNTPVVPTLATHDREGTAKMLADALKAATSTADKKNLIIQTLVVALYNLPPVGHGELLSAKQEIALRENVANVNPTKDLYGNLGLADGASADAVATAAAAKSAALAHATSSEAKAELAQIAYAKQVLTNPNTKDLYDAAKIEPTVTSKVMGKTLYISMSKIAPTTFIEFGRMILSATTTPGLDSIILDLRGNLGGALDFATQFIGLFVGQNQYVYDLFHQGIYDPQRTTTPYFPELARYKDIAVLTDGMTQSTAEVTTAAMKRLHLAHVVGETTRGWGTVENTFPLDTIIDPAEKYSMLLVHSLTLREDQQPIESNGVTPDVSIKDSNWKSELASYFKSASLIAALKTTAAKTL